MSTPAAPRRVSVERRESEQWRERSARLYEELARPARAMVRRAFRGAFCDDELDDVYAGAWVGVLRALERRHADLADEEIRSYVFTAVANQAGKELRRRGRKPTAPLDLAAGAPDPTITPEETAVAAEASRVTRDLLSSLPPRRRAVMLLRYGWGLDPKQVCGLVEGLSPRAYRKEVTRGVDELTERMRTVERGDWCDEREPVLKAFASGIADADQELQAQAHLAHCRGCSEFVAKLSGNLHELGGAALAPGTIDVLDGRLSLGERLVGVGDRIREAAAGALSRGPNAADEGTVSLATAGAGTRGAGAAGAGVVAKLAGLGTAGKVALVCLGGGAAATACVASGVAPLALGTGDETDRLPVKAAAAEAPPGEQLTPPPVALTPQADVPDAAPKPDRGPAGDEEQATAPQLQAPPPAPAPAPVAPAAPPVEQEFGVAAAAAPATTSARTAAASGGGGGGGAGGSGVQQEFGP